MDEFEFRQLIDLFPVVRSRDYHVDLDSSRRLSQSSQSEEVKDWSAETSGNDIHDAFWDKLKLATARKVGVADAEIFCKAFQQVYKKLVNEELTLDAAKSFMNTSS